MCFDFASWITHVPIPRERLLLFGISGQHLVGQMEEKKLYGI